MEKKLKDSDNSVFEKLDNQFFIYLGAQLIFLATSFFIQSNDFFNFESIDKSLIIVMVIITSSFAVFLSRFLIAGMLKSAITKDNESKIQIYIRTFHIRFSLYTIAIIISQMAFIVTSDYIFIGLFAAIFFLNFAHKPSQNNFAKSINNSH